MKKICLLVIGCLVLWGCSKEDAHTESFDAAIQDYLDKTGDLCLDLKDWPADFDKYALQINKDKKLKALERLGLVTSRDVEIGQRNTFGKPTGDKETVKRYELTEKGRRYYREKEVQVIGSTETKKVMQGDICYGKKTFDKVVKWKGPMKLGDYQGAVVEYHFNIEGKPDWIATNEFKEAFPTIYCLVEEAGPKTLDRVVFLTGGGWGKKGLK